MMDNKLIISVFTFYRFVVICWLNNWFFFQFSRNVQVIIYSFGEVKRWRTVLRMEKVKISYFTEWTWTYSCLQLFSSLFCLLFVNVLLYLKCWWMGLRLFLEYNQTISTLSSTLCPGSTTTLNCTYNNTNNTIQSNTMYFLFSG